MRPGHLLQTSQRIQRYGYNGQNGDCPEPAKQGGSYLLLRGSHEYYSWIDRSRSNITFSQIKLLKIRGRYRTLFRSFWTDYTTMADIFFPLWIHITFESSTVLLRHNGHLPDIGPFLAKNITNLHHILPKYQFCRQNHAFTAASNKTGHTTDQITPGTIFLGVRVRACGAALCFHGVREAVSE